MKEEHRSDEINRFEEVLNITAGKNPTIYSLSGAKPEPFWHKFSGLSGELESSLPDAASTPVLFKEISELSDSIEAVSNEWIENYSTEELEKVDSLMWESTMKIFEYIRSVFGYKTAISIYLRAISERVISPYEVPVEIKSTPEELKVEINNVIANKCFSNSYEVATNNHDVHVVEGVILLKSKDNKAKVIAHLWNRLGDSLHFDVTKDAVFANHPEIDSLEYFPGLVYLAEDLVRVPEWKFTEQTEGVVKDLNDLLKK